MLGSQVDRPQNQDTKICTTLMLRQNVQSEIAQAAKHPHVGHMPRSPKDWFPRLHEQPLALCALVRSAHQSMACEHVNGTIQKGIC